MKKIMALSLLIVAGGVTACESTTSNNANLRGANTNTGYMSNNANTASPMPMSSPSQMMNSNMSPTGGMNNNMKSDSDMKKPMNSNIKAPMNSNMNKNMNSKMNRNSQ